MTSANSDSWLALEEKTFLALLVLISVTFAWVVWQFYGAVFWATVLAILFNPLFRRLLRPFGQRRTLAALTTLIIILLMVILPLVLVSALVLQEAAGVFQRIQSGELSAGRYLEHLYDTLPAWLAKVLNMFGLTDFGVIQQRVSAALAKSSQAITAQIYNVGQRAFDFIVSAVIMLYLLFFFLRDGHRLARRIEEAIPLRGEDERNLSDKFATVIRATIKGNLVVAIAQGALGGVAFSFLGIHAPLLWAVLMTLLSLLPALGAAVVWVPVAIYLLVTGAVWQGIVLIAYGVLVIGLIDNILRPILVGKETMMPDYVVLISTLGGIAIFGVNGLVIGPVIAAMFIAVWEIFSTARSASNQEPTSR